MNYSEALSFIEQSRYLGSSLGLTRSFELSALVGSPHKKLKFIHIAGTNGKGSTAAMIAAVLKNSGIKTGLYCSPFLDDIREIIKINGKIITKNEFAFLCQRLKKAALKMQDNPPTEYELLTVLALLAYERAGCEIVVLETCLGGRLDVTNIVENTLVSVITSISLDHTQILGSDVAAIAAEKCGIIKNGSTVISYPLQENKVLKVIKKFSDENGSSFTAPNIDELKIQRETLRGSFISYKGENYYIPLSGRHQIYNAITAFEAIFLLKDKFNYPIENISEGLRKTKHEARQEYLNRHPLIILDGAHNPAGALMLSDFIKTRITKKPLTLIMGTFKDKDYEKMLEHLAPLADEFIAVKPLHPRGLDASALLNAAKKINKNAVKAENIEEALQITKNRFFENGAIIIAGSLSLAAKAKKAVKKIYG